MLPSALGATSWAVPSSCNVADLALLFEGEGDLLVGAGGTEPIALAERFRVRLHLADPASNKRRKLDAESKAAAGDSGAMPHPDSPPLFATLGDELYSLRQDLVARLVSPVADKGRPFVVFEFRDQTSLRFRASSSLSDADAAKALQT